MAIELVVGISPKSGLEDSYFAALATNSVALATSKWAVTLPKTTNYDPGYCVQMIEVFWTTYKIPSVAYTKSRYELSIDMKWLLKARVDCDDDDAFSLGSGLNRKLRDALCNIGHTESFEEMYIKGVEVLTSAGFELRPV